MTRKKSAFSLVEILVVIGIIAILIGILLPTLSIARTRSRRVACAAQLRDVGNFFQMYLNENKGRLPRVNPMPSMTPKLNPFISIYATLEPYVKTATGVWRCPADRITQEASGTADGHETYFDREGGSYVYHEFLNAFAVDLKKGLINRMFLEAVDQWKQRTGRTADQMIVFHEYEAWHAKPQTANAMNYLFADFHVGDLEGGAAPKVIVINQK